MVTNVFDTLQQRGFIKQTTHDGLKEMLGNNKVKFYVGFDATADSLHVGHFVQLMAMAHMQRAGHVPIVLIGGGTTMIGDPSGKSDMRRMMTREIIAENAEIFKRQIGKFLDFSDDKAIMVDNADWLLELNYVEFLREIGTCFSVNRMLTADCYKQRLEKGLTFFEFNYMLMQAYDFLVLNRKYGCTLEMG
ncbi:MAG: tyrosine--tRNA ligase, partial [Christensenella sp.]